MEEFEFSKTLKFINPAIHQEIQLRLLKEEILPERIDLGMRYAKEIEEGGAPSHQVKWVSEKVGFGLFAEEDIEPGTFIGEYTGLLRRSDLFETLNGYLYRYPVTDHLGKHFVIDAKEVGNHTRFINHHFQPNLKCCWAFHANLYHMILIALKPIAKGDQFSYNYGNAYWAIRGAPELLDLLRN